MVNSNGQTGYPVYIPDGYTIDAYIAAVPRLHDAIRFKFRALPIIERTTIMKGIEAAPTPEHGETLCAEVIKRQVIEWDAVFRGDILPLDVNTMLHMHYNIFMTMFLIVVGRRASDPDPTDMKNALPQQSELSLQQILQRSPAETVLSGNSSGQSD